MERTCGWLTDRLILWLAPDFVEEEIAVAVRVGAGGGGGVEMHDLPLVCCVVGWPFGEAGVVGVAGGGEVGPIGADLVGELAVFGPPGGSDARVERAEDVLDVVGVEGADDRGMEFVAGGAEIEAVTVDMGFAGVDLGLQPAPGGEGDEAVAGEISGRRHGLGVGGRGIDGEDVLYVFAEAALEGGGEP